MPGSESGPAYLDGAFFEIRFFRNRTGGVEGQLVEGDGRLQRVLVVPDDDGVVGVGAGELDGISRCAYDGTPLLLTETTELTVTATAGLSESTVRTATCTRLDPWPAVLVNVCRPK